MNREFRRLKRQVEQMQKKDQSFIIKLIDKTYLVKGQQLTEIDIIPKDLKLYEVDALDKEFFYFFTREVDNMPVYTIIRSVSESQRRVESEILE